MNKKQQEKRSKAFSKKFNYYEENPAKVIKTFSANTPSYISVPIEYVYLKYSFFHFLLTYWWVTVALDWGSTVIAHDWRVEENPLIRNIWKNYGDMGLTLTTIFFGILITIAIVLNEKYGHKRIIYPFLLLMITFKFLIALTNLAVIPYWITGWFQF